MAVRSAFLATLISVLALPMAAQAAVHSPPAGTLSNIDGVTAYAQYHSGLAVRDLRTGADRNFQLPDNYAVWNDAPVVGHGRFAGVTESGNLARVFETGADGINYLSSWTADDSECSTRQVPLGISASGAVTILELARERGAGGHGCVVNAAQTHLRLRSLSGRSRGLWLPSRYAKWLASGSASLRGNRLLISQPANDGSGGKFVVLDLSKQKVIRQIAAGKTFVTAVMTARDGALATYQRGAKVAARHFSFYLERSKLVFRGKNANFVACGQRTAVLKVGSFTLLGLRGKRLFHKEHKGNYDYSSAVCSDQILHYALEPNVPAMGDDPNLPPRISGTIDMSIFPE